MAGDATPGREVLPAGACEAIEPRSWEYRAHWPVAKVWGIGRPRQTFRPGRTGIRIACVAPIPLESGWRGTPVADCNSSQGERRRRPQAAALAGPGHGPNCRLCNSLSLVGAE